MARQPRPYGSTDPVEEWQKWQCSECGDRVNLFDKNWKQSTSAMTDVPGSGWVHQCKNTLGNPDKTWYLAVKVE